MGYAVIVTDAGYSQLIGNAALLQFTWVFTSIGSASQDLHGTHVLNAAPPSEASGVLARDGFHIVPMSLLYMKWWTG